MKKYLFIAIVLVSGAISTATKLHAVSSPPSCPGSGQDCAYDHGTTYVKCKTC